MDAFLNELFSYLMKQTWQIAAVFVAVAIAVRLLRHRSAHSRYLLWLIVLAKVLIPPMVSIPLAVLPEQTMPIVAAPPTPVAEPGPTLALAPAELSGPLNISESADSTHSTLSLTGQTVGQLKIAPSAAPTWQWPTFSAMQYAAIAWLAIAAMVGVVAAGRAWRAGRQMSSRRQPADEAVVREIATLSASLGLKRIPTAWMLEGIPQPFVWGVVRGSVYLPANFGQSMSDEHRRSVLLHELAHIARCDALINTLQVIAQAVFFFHPLVYVANAMIRREREKCCDEIAVARLGASPRVYSSAIVETLVREYERKQRVPTLAIAGPVKNIEDRIKTLMTPNRTFRVRPSRVAVATVVVLAALAVPTALVLTTRTPDVKMSFGDAGLDDYSQQIVDKIGWWQDASITVPIGQLVEYGGPKAIPILIGIMDCDNSRDIIYYVGHFGLSQITNVDYSKFHDGPWWRRWWQKNQWKYPEEVRRIAIPDLPRTRAGRKHVATSESMDTLEGQLAWLVEKIKANDTDAIRNSQIGSLIARHEDWRAVPTLIGVIDADNSYDTTHSIGYLALRQLTGVEYNTLHDGPWWRRWWQKNKAAFASDVQQIAIPDLPKTSAGRKYVSHSESLEVPTVGAISLTAACDEDMAFAIQSQTNGNVWKDKNDLDRAYTKWKRCGHSTPAGREAAIKEMTEYLAKHKGEVEYEWRIYSLLGQIAEEMGRLDLAETYLTQSMDAYPIVAYSEPSKHSKYQHILNHKANVIAEQRGIDAAEAFAVDQLENNPRCEYIFDLGWQQQSTLGKPRQAFLSRLYDAYEARKTKFPQRAALATQYQKESSLLAAHQAMKATSQPTTKLADDATGSADDRAAVTAVVRTFWAAAEKNDEATMRRYVAPNHIMPEDQMRSFGKAKEQLEEGRRTNTVPRNLSTIESIAFEGDLCVVRGQSFNLPTSWTVDPKTGENRPDKYQEGAAVVLLQKQADAWKILCITGVTKAHWGSVISDYHASLAQRAANVKRLAEAHPQPGIKYHYLKFVRVVASKDGKMSFQGESAKKPVAFNFIDLPDRGSTVLEYAVDSDGWTVKEIEKLRKTIEEESHGRYFAYLSFIGAHSPTSKGSPTKFFATGPLTCDKKISVGLRAEIAVPPYTEAEPCCPIEITDITFSKDTKQSHASANVVYASWPKSTWVYGLRLLDDTGRVIYDSSRELVMVKQEIGGIIQGDAGVQTGNTWWNLGAFDRISKATRFELSIQQQAPDESRTITPTTSPTKSEVSVKDKPTTPPTTPAADAVPPDKATVVVKVVDEAGQPVEGAEILPYGVYYERKPDGTVSWLPPKVAATTDRQGVASVSCPSQDASGRDVEFLTLGINHPKYARCRQTFTIGEQAKPVVLHPGETARFVGYHGDRSHPITPIIVRMGYFRESEPPRVEEWQLQSDGSLITHRLWAGEICVQLVHRDENKRLWFSDWTYVTIERGKPAEIALEMNPGLRFEGRLDDSVPRPVKNGRVSVWVHPSNIKSVPGNIDEFVGGQIDWETWCEIGADGRFVFESLPSGTMDISAACDGYVRRHDPAMTDKAEKAIPSRTPVCRQLVNVATSRTDEIIDMEPAATCCVQVVDEQDRPIPGAKVDVCYVPNICFSHEGSPYSLRRFSHSFNTFFMRSERELDPPADRKSTSPWDPVAYPYRAVTDAKGVATIGTLPEGDVYLTVAREGYTVVSPRSLSWSATPNMWGSADVYAGQTTTVKMTMRPTRATDAADFKDQVQFVRSLQQATTQPMAESDAAIRVVLTAFWAAADRGDTRAIDELLCRSYIDPKLTELLKDPKSLRSTLKARGVTDPLTIESMTYSGSFAVVLGEEFALRSCAAEGKQHTNEANCQWIPHRMQTLLQKEDDGWRIVRLEGVRKANGVSRMINDYYSVLVEERAAERERNRSQSGAGATPPTTSQAARGPKSAGDAAKPSTKPADDGKVECGGRIVDEDGKPIADVQVEIFWYNSRQYLQGERVTTDRDGRWTCRLLDEVPDIFIRLCAADHLSYHFDQSQRRPEIATLRDRSCVLVMKRGVRVRGVVTYRGIKLKNALVAAADGYGTSDKGLVEDSTCARTAADGTFSIGGLPTGPRSFVVLAEGYAPSIATVELSKESIAKPIELSVDHGQTYEGDVIDGDGQAVADAKVICDCWRIDRSDVPLGIEVNSDAKGHFRIENLPKTGTLDLTFWKRDYQRVRRTMACERPSPERIVLLPIVTVTGQVVDDATGEPIRAYELVPGCRWQASDPLISWNTDYAQRLTVADGMFKISEFGAALWHPYEAVHLRIIAKGYFVEVSPGFKVNSAVAPLTIRLKRAEPWIGIVVDAQGRPAPGAEVGWVDTTRKAQLINGRFSGERIPDQADLIVRTDATGRFELPPTRDTGFLFIVQDAGFARIEKDAFLASKRIALTPWGRIEGRIDRRDASRKDNYVVLIEDRPEREVYATRVWNSNENVILADAEGRFVFDRVRPGRWRICRATQTPTVQYEHSETQIREVKSGQTVRVEFAAEPQETSQATTKSSAPAARLASTSRRNLPAMVRFRGQLRDERDGPIVGKEILLTADASDGSNASIDHITTDQNGRFDQTVQGRLYQIGTRVSEKVFASSVKAIDCSQPGEYVAELVLMNPTSDRAEVKILRLKTPADIGKPWRIQGRLTQPQAGQDLAVPAAGVPLKCAMIKTADGKVPTSSPITLTTTTGADGTYAFDGSVEGEYEISVPEVAGAPIQWAGAWHIISTLAGQRYNTGIIPVDYAGFLEIIVLDEKTRQPVSDCSALIYLTKPYWKGLKGINTDRNGHIHLAVLAGEYGEITLGKAGYEKNPVNSPKIHVTVGQATKVELVARPTK